MRLSSFYFYPPLEGGGKETGMRKRPCFLPAPGRPSLEISGSPQSEAARNAKGPYGPTRLDASRHRGLSKQLETQVHQTNGVPRAVFVRFAPRRSRWETRSFAAPVTDATTLHRRTPATRPACPDRHALGLPGRQGVLACGLHAGLDAAWTAGRDKWRRISNAPYRPPRPASASGVLIKRPSVVEAGYMEYRPSVGLKSSGFCFFFPLPTGSRRRRGPPGGRLLREREKEGGPKPSAPRRVCA